MQATGKLLGIANNITLIIIDWAHTSLSVPSHSHSIIMNLSQDEVMKLFVTKHFHC